MKYSLRTRLFIMKMDIRCWCTRFWHDTLPFFVTRCFPRRIVSWCAIRVAANATTGKYSGQVVPDLTAMDAVKRWDDK